LKSLAFSFIKPLAFSLVNIQEELMDHEDIGEHLAVVVSNFVLDRWMDA